MNVRTGLIAVTAVLAIGSPRAQATPPKTVVKQVEIRGKGDQAEVVVDGEFAVPTYAVRARDQGAVIVLEIRDATLPAGGLKVTGGSALVTRTTASTTARGVRVEVALGRAAAYRARASHGKIVVGLEALSTASGSRADIKARTASRPGADITSQPLSVQNVQIERRDGRDRVVIDLNRPGEFRVSPGSVGPAKLEVKEARIGERAQRMIESDGGGTIRQVRLRSMPTGTVVEVDRAAGGTATAIREGTRIVWLFAPPQANDGRPKPKTIAREDFPPELRGDGEVETPEAAPFTGGLSAAQMRGGARIAAKGTYSGRRIDLDFKDADIHNILRLISEVGGVNVVTSDDVKGAVTIRMRNVPWDQALDVILQAKGLGMVRRGNLIRVAPLEALEKEREAAIARQKQQVELAPLETRLIPVSYATADKLKPRVTELLSSRGTVSTDERTNVLIVRDLAENLDDVEELIRTLDTQTPQVLVEARIVEATSQYSRDIGIQWGGDVTMGSATGNPTGLVFPSDVGIAGGNYNADTPTQGLSPFTSQVANPNFAVNLPATVGNGQGGALGLSLGSLGGNVNLNVRLSAAEANGIVRIISSPRILTLDNHEAHIAQGTLIPYSQVSAQGVQTAFQEAKLQLIVRPHVTSDGSVGMHVKVTRDEPDFTRTSSRGDPTILKREAETDLLVSDTHTAVIGGIFTRNSGRNVDQVPLFGDIPILGILFQRRRVRDERNELLIFLTPRIVNRNEALQR